MNKVLSYYLENGIKQPQNQVFIIFSLHLLERVITPKVESVRKINVGYRSATELGFSNNSNAERNVLEESLMLTGDQNIVRCSLYCFI